MEFTAKSVIRGLKNLRKFVEKLDKKKHKNETTENKIEDTVTGCFDLLQYGRTNVSDWIKTKKRRSKLNGNRRKLAWTKEGKRSILDLIELTLSEVDACQGFWPKRFNVSCLPITGGFKRSQEHVKRMQEGREARREREREEQQRRLQNL